MPIWTSIEYHVTRNVAKLLISVSMTSTCYMPPRCRRVYYVNMDVVLLRLYCNVPVDSVEQSGRMWIKPNVENPQQNNKSWIVGLFLWLCCNEACCCCRCCYCTNVHVCPEKPFLCEPGPGIWQLGGSITYLPRMPHTWALYIGFHTNLGLQYVAT